LSDLLDVSRAWSQANVPDVLITLMDIYHIPQKNRFSLFTDKGENLEEFALSQKVKRENQGLHLFLLIPAPQVFSTHHTRPLIPHLPTNVQKARCFGDNGQVSNIFFAKHHLCDHGKLD
jgi:hypothetical protein